MAATETLYLALDGNSEVAMEPTLSNQLICARLGLNKQDVERKVDLFLKELVHERFTTHYGEKIGTTLDRRVEVAAKAMDPKISVMINEAVRLAVNAKVLEVASKINLRITVNSEP